MPERRLPTHNGATLQILNMHQESTDYKIQRRQWDKPGDTGHSSSPAARDCAQPETNVLSPL